MTTKSTPVKSEMERALKAAGRVSLRPVKPEDEAFLIEVYTSTRADELALVPWSEEQKQAFILMQFKAQQDHYSKYYPDSKHEIILYDGRPVGRLWVERNDQDMGILDVVVLPADRNQGIGSYLLKELLDEAAQTRRSLRVHVESFNPSLRFFERLGFAHTETEGVYILMKWTASTNDAPA